MPRHLLLTNDFPPKVGGIQTYLWELWRRLDPVRATVHCTPHEGSAAFDAEQSYAVLRSREPVLLPYPWLARRVRRLMTESGADLVLIDPALPLGLVGPFLRRPYGVVLHGAEVAIPARLPVVRRLLRQVLERSSLVVAAGQYALDEAERCVGHRLPGVVITPGVDLERFTPPSSTQRAAARERFGLAPGDTTVAVVTRLVPRKGMHTLVEAAGLLADSHPELRVLIGGRGRQLSTLQKMIVDHGARVELVGPLSDEDVERLYHAADIMAMPCQRRWWGLEQEGFGIVFLEAAASGIPQIAGRSGGSDEAVVDGQTGFVVDPPDDPCAVAEALRRLLDDPDLRRSQGVAARRRVEALFDYRHLADRLQTAIDDSIEALPRVSGPPP